MPPSQIDPEAAREAAEEILARPEYREPEPSLADRALEAIGDLLGRAIATLTGGGAGSVIGTVVVVALLALAAWLVARALRAPGGRARGGVEVGVVQGTEAPTDPEVWAAEADRLARIGDHRGALRCRHQELVARLVRERVVPPDPARTPAELRARLSADRPDLAPHLAELTERFEATWYGGEPVDAGTYERFARRAAELTRAATAVPA